LKNGAGIKTFTNKLVNPHPHKLHDEDEPRYHKRANKGRYERFNDKAVENAQALSFGKNKSVLGYKPPN
jgi:hypothetical protein